MSAQSLLRDSSCAQNTAHKSLPTQKNTKLYGRHRTPYNLVFIWCFNLQNGQLRKVTIHIFESHKSPQYGTFQHFALLYGGNQLLLEKEGIWTFDAKGELLITIMSSLAQEESRSISENVTWGKRKSAADGKVSVAYSRFLGYRKGENSIMQVVPEEAAIIRQIYTMFIKGMTPHTIAAALTEQGIPTPTEKKNWQPSTVLSILSNEKYKGDALLQKTFTTDFLTKKIKCNEGEVPQYYVKNSYEGIIDPEDFDFVQAELSRRKALGGSYRGTSCFSAKLVCGDCGGFYGSKVWHSTSKYRRTIWQCNS